MQIHALEEPRLTDKTNEPQSETPEPSLEPQQDAAEQESTAMVTTEPEVIEGEVIELAQPETSADHLPSQQHPYRLLIPFTIVLCLVFVGGSLLLPILSPTATITILPVVKTISLTTAIRIPVRALPALTLTQRISVVATGKRHQDATHASGTITFYNGLLSPQTIPVGTILTGVDGVQIITDQVATIPAGNPPIYGHVSVPAHAARSGASGNINSFDINTPCCATSVVAKNLAAFRGGAKARDVRVVRRGDINSAITSLLITLSQSEDAALHVQLHEGEALLPTACAPHPTANHQPGDEAHQVSVTVSLTCTGIAYAAHDVYQIAQKMITSQARALLGTTYALLGDIRVTIVHATSKDLTIGIVTLALKIDATYLYQIRPTEKERLSTLLVGKPKQQAISALLQFPGIQAASIHLAGSNTTLPTDPHHIQIIVMYKGR